MATRVSTVLTANSRIAVADAPDRSNSTNVWLKTRMDSVSVATERSSARGDEDDRHHLHVQHEEDDDDGDDRVAQVRQRDADETAPDAAAVHPEAFAQLLRNRLQRAQEQQHGLRVGPPGGDQRHGDQGTGLGDENTSVGPHPERRGDAGGGPVVGVQEPQPDRAGDCLGHQPWQQEQASHRPLEAVQVVEHDRGHEPRRQRDDQCARARTPESCRSGAGSDGSENRSTKEFRPENSSIGSRSLVERGPRRVHERTDEHEEEHRTDGDRVQPDPAVPSELRRATAGRA